ncbi:MAG: hypothetical protein ACQETJ_10260, partial [Bacteroidota bacterium]
MQKRLYIFCFLWLSIFLWSPSLLASPQDWNIKNFSKKEYQAANQNWSVDASPNGFMYFANHAGLLEFDGTSWALYRLPNQTILRSVRVFNDSIIFTGGYREIGYWQADREGKLNYSSLNHLAREHLGDNDEFWNISFLNDAVYFHYFTKILKCKNNKITSVELPGFVTSMNRVDDKILIGIRDKGVYAISDEKSEPFITDPQLESAIIRFIIPY